LANRRCWLTKVVKVNGKWTTRPVVFTPIGNLLTDRVLVEDREVPMKGIFVLEWWENGQRLRRRIGKDVTKAQTALTKQNMKMLAKAIGVPVVEEEPDAKKHHFEIATKVYVSHLQSKQREDKTIRAIEQNLQFLQEATGRVYVEDIQQSDVTEEFVQALQGKGYSRQTVFDRYARVVSFLKFCSKRFGTKRAVELNDGPARPRPKNDVDFSKKDPYTEQELNTLFSNSIREEKLFWKFCLDTGAREKEVIYATWKNLDLEHRLFHIRSHEKMGFRTKDRSSRTVPFTQELADALRERRAHSKGLLVFGKDSKPARHMIRILKKRALDAGLNCGMCVNSKGESCKDKPVCENWYIHRFRHTFANYHLRNGVDVPTVSKWLGHSDLATTNIYAQAIKSKSMDTKLKVDSTFAKVKSGL